ncbi:MAG: NUMOD4 domain-containing protein [Bacteroidia bacterium]
MIKVNKNEIWKPIRFKKGINARSKYAVSNLGRIASYSKKVEDGNLLNGTTLGGYKAISMRNLETSQTLYIHKLVAENFVKKTNPRQKFVIHLDHNKENNKVKNLSWATYAEIGLNLTKNPERKLRLQTKPSNSKLTPAKVSTIKSLLAKGKLAGEIAQRFGMSNMQIYRIKRGEVWSSVK